jgi:hypothetical protein
VLTLQNDLCSDRQIRVYGTGNKEADGNGGEDNPAKAGFSAAIVIRGTHDTTAVSTCEACVTTIFPTNV